MTNKNQTPNRMRVVSSSREPAPFDIAEVSEQQTGPQTATVSSHPASKLLFSALFLAASCVGGIAASLWLAR